MDTGGENTDVQTVKVLWQGEVKLNTIHIQFNFNSKVPPYPNNKTTASSKSLATVGRKNSVLTRKNLESRPREGPVNEVNKCVKMTWETNCQNKMCCSLKNNKYSSTVDSGENSLWLSYKVPLFNSHLKISIQGRRKHPFANIRSRTLKFMT